MSKSPEGYQLKEEDHADNFFNHSKLHKNKTKKDIEKQKKEDLQEDPEGEKEWYFEKDKHDPNTTYIKFVGEVTSKAS